MGVSASFQQQSRVRKLIYVGLMGALLTGTMLLRSLVVEPQAKTLAMREENLGEVELTGSAVRLVLTGSRGLVVCFLWSAANEKKKKHEWNEVEMIVKSLTKLQPYFISPWIFHSWNLAYNVAWECDSVKDKYFYISRGTELLAEGERRNRDNPDLRRELGTLYLFKFGQASDERDYLRSLLQISCIDPKERAFHRLRRTVGGKSEVNLEEFQNFCREHPQLVRRLREKLGCDKPEKVVEFLEDNGRIPSLYEETAPAMGLAKTPKSPLEKRFPLLPPPSRFDGNELTFDSNLLDEFDNYDAARAWFSYAQDPVDDPDPNRRRRPRLPELKIFQGFPALSQTAHAQRLEEEGWFDTEGWTIKDWFPAEGSRGKKKPFVVGDGRSWAAEAWEKAFRLYERHGKEHGLLLDEGQGKNPKVIKTYEADGNFEHFYQTSKVKRTKEAVASRKQFFLAERLRKAGAMREALMAYRHPSAFGEPDTWNKPTGWKKLFLDNPDFRNDPAAQQEAYEIQLRYLDLERELSGCLGEQMNRLIVLQNTFNAAAWPPAAALWMPSAILSREFPMPLKGPFDDTIEVFKDGRKQIVPLIEPKHIEDVYKRLAATYNRPSGPLALPAPANPPPGR